MALFIRTANREIKLEKNDRKKKKKRQEKVSYIWIAEEVTSILKIHLLGRKNQIFGSSGLELVIIFFNSYKKIIGFHHTFFW